MTWRGPRLLRLLSRAVSVATAFIGIVAAALALAVARTPLPDTLLHREPPASVAVVDRDGKLVREVRTERGELAAPVRLPELAPGVVPALLAAEDARFYRHLGVDPLAMGRAATQALFEGRIVSGASTLTQQLARAVFERPRTFAGKLREIVVALRIDRDLGKDRILEEYLSRVEFGPNLRGIQAASHAYFDKPASALDLSEAAALVAIPRGPTLYDPRRSLRAVLLRRNRILERLRRAGTIDGAAIDRAIAEPLRLQAPFVEGGALHFALGLARGAIPSGLPSGNVYGRIETTLDAALQREVETLSRRAAWDAAGKDASALAVLVVDNATGDVLAYVGSPDYFDAGKGGANDGVRALRQPGSALKPFVYAAAMETTGLTAATLLPDVELTLPTAIGPYTPRNYDGRFHGPVRLRNALANSLNVPAVVTASNVGPDRVLSVLHAAGFASLDAPAEHYGVALALGDGEVRLTELAEAYAMLARGGERVPLRLVKAAKTADGRTVVPSRGARTRVLDARTVGVLTDVLSDPVARAASFGRGSVLELPFPVAVKTGTSKGYRDNWTVGFTHEITVAVWAGNFDGSPMHGSTGVTGAGPLFRDVMTAAMRGRAPAELVDHEGLVEVEVCSLSGERAGPGCAHRTREWFRPDRLPDHACTFHVHARIDPTNGLLAGPGCADAEERTFERYPPRYAAWAKAAGRPLLPERSSPRCPVAVPGGGTTALAASDRPAAVRFPREGARFVVDPGGPERQEIVLAARPASDQGEVRFVLDGRTVGTVPAPFELPWRLSVGTHRLEVASVHGEKSPPVTFEVAAAE